MKPKPWRTTGDVLTQNHSRPKQVNLTPTCITCIYLYMYVYTYTHVCVYVYVCTHMYTHMCTYIHILVAFAVCNPCNVSRLACKRLGACFVEKNASHQRWNEGRIGRRVPVSTL